MVSVLIFFVVDFFPFDISGRGYEQYRFGDFPEYKEKFNADDSLYNYN